MKKAALVVAVLVAFAWVAAQSLDPSQQPPPWQEGGSGIQPVVWPVKVTNFPPLPLRMQLVGFSGKTLDASAGVLNFTLACQEVFPESRMCSSEEVIETVQIPSAPVPPGSGIVSAWVRPRIVGFTGDRVLDISGVSDFLSNGGLSCNGWEFNSSDRIALTVTYDSDAQYYPIFHGKPCSWTLPVACCAPVQGGA